MRAAIGLMVLVFACSAPVWAQKAGGAQPQDASTYVTFFVLKGNSPDARDEDVTAAIAAALADHGLLETPPEDAEAVVVINTATSAKHSRPAFYQGWGGWDWRRGEVRSNHRSEDYKPGTLVVDVFDAWSKKLVWQGAASLPETSGASAGRAIQKTVRRIFRDFSPVGDDAGSRPLTLTQTSGLPDTLMRIVFSPTPALLVSIDGEPRYENVAGTSLQRVANTEALILRDESGIHYMRLGQAWMEAYDLIGSWSRAGSVPEGADIAPQKSANRQPIDVFTASYADDPLPTVYVATTPTALIVTDGEPEYAPYRGMALLYLRNTLASVFKEPTDKELYVHLPGGWFRSWTTNGPWQQIPERALPADLANLPPVAAGS
jgi:uncharacterized protein DUF4136